MCMLGIHESSVHCAAAEGLFAFIAGIVIWAFHINFIRKKKSE